MVVLKGLKGPKNHSHYIYTTSCLNTPSMLQYGNNRKIYMTASGSSPSFIEYPGLGTQSRYFMDMVLRFGGKKYRQANGMDAYRVKCPACGCPGAIMGLGRKGTTYMLLCPNTGKCSLPSHTNGSAGGLNLHQLINHYGGDKLLKEWLREGRKSNCYEDWLPIKNRRPK